MNDDPRQLLRTLPSVSAVLEHEDVKEWLGGLPRSAVVAAVQSAIESTRGAILRGEHTEPVDVHHLIAQAEAELVERSTPSLRPVINATGIVLHTGLGRAPLCDAAIEAIAEGASGYCNLEIDLHTGQRGHRPDHVRRLLCDLLGAESATVVNNNAAATFLILRALAAGREVIVSRGQLIEIGGSFRLPDIMRESGAILREVGTTNRTRIADYEQAINERTAILLRVHTSNYRILGFTEDVSIADLASLAHRFRLHNLLAVDDLGSGALLELRPGAAEPLAPASIAAGADLICFSGDKLLGGPQCGIIAGKRSIIERLESHPLMRAFRVDKLTLLALEATLRHYLDPDEARTAVPTSAMLSASPDELAARAGSLQEQLEKALPGEQFFVGSDVGFAGGGAMPAEPVPTVVVQWRPAHRSVDATMMSLRGADTPVMARVRDDAICFDLRTLRPLDIEPLIASICASVWEEEPDAPSDDVPLPIL